MLFCEVLVDVGSISTPNVSTDKGDIGHYNMSIKLITGADNDVSDNIRFNRSFSIPFAHNKWTTLKF